MRWARSTGAALALHGSTWNAASLTNAQALYRRLGFTVSDTYANCEKVVSLA